MQTGFMRRMLLTSAATMALLTAPAMAVSSFEQTAPGFFNFTIHETGTYQLTIGGATSAGIFGAYVGGAGAFFSGSVYMGIGVVFSGLVGGNGVNGGGGGGLSYFLSGATKAYVGGGGSASFHGPGFDSNDVGGSGSGGSAGGGTLSFAGGGAGVAADGGSNGSITGGSSSPTWSGGTSSGVASGGLGGGGGGGYYNGGGGGGYTGGNAGSYAGGQGGTSYYAGFIAPILQGGTDRKSSPYASDLGDGFFSLTLIPPAAVPVPASLGLLGLAIAGLIAQSRRRKA
jgi:hypothetical protein